MSWKLRCILITFFFFCFFRLPCLFFFTFALRLRFYLDVPLANVCCFFTATELKPTEQLRQQSCCSNFEKFQCDVDVDVVLEVDPIGDLKLARAWAFVRARRQSFSNVCELWTSSRERERERSAAGFKRAALPDRGNGVRETERVWAAESARHSGASKSQKLAALAE